MRTRNEFILADLIAARAEATPELDVLTFEHLSVDGGATPDEVRTFADLYRNANRIAAALVERGVTPGDRFGLMMRNHPEFVEAMIAASITGMIFVPIDPRTRGDKLAFMLANSGCVGIVCAEYCLPELEAVRERLPSLRWTLVRETTLRDVLSHDAATIDLRVEDLDEKASHEIVGFDLGEAHREWLHDRGIEAVHRERGEAIAEPHEALGRRLRAQHGDGMRLEGERDRGDSAVVGIGSDLIENDRVTAVYTIEVTDGHDGALEAPASAFETAKDPQVCAGRGRTSPSPPPQPPIC